MADKITNFEDYKRELEKDHRSHKPEKVKEAEPEVSQKTMEIEIEDPFQFLNEEEREEYILQRQKERADQAKEGEVQAEHKEEEKSLQNEEKKPPHRPMLLDEDVRPEEEPLNEPEPLPDGEEDPEDGYEDEYDDEEYEDQEYQEEYRETEDTSQKVNMTLLIRIASAITGVILLVLIGMVIKTKVIDRFLYSDPDEAQTVEIAVPEGYTATNDTVVVSGASLLNLRTGPDTGSAIITAVDEGTALHRIGVADDGTWALVEYQGQQLYASMKYLTEQ